jgi:NAD(P)H dehydrogenase (quinone)
MYRMIVVGGSDWQSAFGASAVTDEEPFDTTPKKQGVNPYFLKKAKGLGTRVAEVVIRFHE